LGVRLTPDERKKLMTNFTGYDISPDMVRLSLVNMYLHGFTTPKIFEYDTLTSEDRWNEYFDVILANPPFMSPKGGIKPHKKFSVQANRSEVLFVDYIAEHIHPATGRAGIIVPEGIIFQSAGAYRQLRKMLVVKDFLYAVVSLPAGIFQPYSGVKTSILLLDKTLARKTNNILFVKIDNDGFDLGAQRRAIDKNDLTGCLLLLQQYKQTLQSGKPFVSDNKNVFLVDKENLAAKDDYNLSIDRYRVNEKVKQSKFEMVRLGDISDRITKGTTPTTSGFSFQTQGIPFIKIESIKEDGYFIPEKFAFVSEACHQSFKRSQLKENDILFSIAGALGRIALVNKEILPANTNQALAIISLKDNIYPKFIFWILKGGSVLKEIENLKTGVAQLNLSLAQINDFEIPLPPLSIQQQIVAKIENYQTIINGAKQIIENYKPQIDINPDWEMVELGDICQNFDSKRKPVTSSDRKKGIYPYYGASGIVDYVEDYIFDDEYLLVSEDGANLLARVTPIAFSVSGKVWVNNHAHILKFKEKATQTFVELYLNSINLEIHITGSAQPKLNQANLNIIPVPLPPLSEQQQIVRRIEEEQALVNGNKKLIAIYEQKIKDEINKLWEKEPVKYETGEGFSVIKKERVGNDSQKIK
jgi:type I restriction enzyme M protein